MRTILLYAHKMFEHGRRTGKTTRLLLRAADALSMGLKVLIITHSHESSRQLSRMLQSVLQNLCGPESVSAMSNSVTFQPSGGYALFVSRNSLERICGGIFDEFYTDPAQLSYEELCRIIPCIRTQSVVGIEDVNHFETEYISDVVEFDLDGELTVRTDEDNEENAVEKNSDVVPKEYRARRTLSSR